MTNNWYALNTKPHKERAVCALLETKPEVEVFFPALRVKPKNPRSAKVRAYFPGYMFVRLDLEQEGKNILNWTPGVKGLVSFGEIPSIVPENLVNALRKQLEMLVMEQEAPFREGEPVRISEGPFMGYEAIFDRALPGRDRVQVLLTFLNQQMYRVKLSSDAIEKMG